MKGRPFEFADIVNRADVGVIQRGSGASFAAKALDGLRVLGNIVGQKFQGHAAAQARVLGLVNDAHATAAQFFQHGVVRNGLPDDGSGVRHWARILRERWATCKPVRGEPDSDNATRQELTNFLPAILKTLVSV